MINNLIQWSLRNRLAVLVVSATLLALGGATTLRMPVDVFPDLTAPTVTVIVEGHGMAPEEMETLVTFPIESAVNGAADVRRVRSATAVGIAVVWIEFEWGTDIYRARQTVTERLAGVSGSLPAEVEPPVLAPISSIMGEILFVSLTSEAPDAIELRTVATSVIRRRLLSIAGVSQVTPIGGDEKQYQVVLSAQRMKAYQLSVAEVAEALERSNENISAGFVLEGGGEAVVRGIGRVRSTDDIAATVVAARHGRPITVGDVGVVELGAAIKRGAGAASMRGPDWEPVTRRGVILAIQKQPAANTLALTRELDAVLDEIQTALPAGMVINKQLFRQSDFIEHSIRNTTAALVEGGAMVLLVVVLFLASLRASAITLVAIPMSLVTAILALRVSGASINTMTLGGMAIAIGALVDDAIIDVENVVRRLRENRARPLPEQRSALSIVFDASVEVRTSIVFATFIILLVFAPLFFLSGVEGRLLRPLGVAFCVSLAASLVTALTLTPALCAYLLPGARTVTRGDEPWIVTALKRAYAAPLRWAMAFPWAVTAPALALLVLAVVGASRMGRNFLPEFNEGALVVGIVTLPGTSLAESDGLAHIVERTLMKHPEIKAIGRRTGRAEEDEHVQGVEASEIDLTLDMEAPERLGLPQRSKDELLEALRNDLAGIPGVRATFGQPIGHRIDHMLSGTRANIAVKIFGDDLGELRELARRTQGLMAEIPGVVDLSAEQQVDVPQVRVELRRDALARHGLHVREASEALNAAFQGGVVGQILEGRSAYDLTLRLERTRGSALASVDDVLVDTPAGYKVPMKALARIYEDRGPNLITREDVQRKIVVMCNVAGRDMGSVVGDVHAAVEAGLDLPPGYHVEYGGQFETAAATNRRLAVLGALVVLGIGFLLHLMFRSVRDTLLIMANLPFALIGGVFGAHLAGGVISVASIIGLISVFGIAARNGIMLVSHVRHLERHEGVDDFVEAVRRGSMERLAPILMTALASGLALVPLALAANEPGTEILTPMAFVILFGLVSSTFLNMLVVPALFVRFGRATPSSTTDLESTGATAGALALEGAEQ
jgi:CzcA family heavy metal efflux pump